MNRFKRIALHWFPMSSEGDEGGGGGTVPPVVVPPVAEEELKNKKEVVDLKKDVRDLKQMIAGLVDGMKPKDPPKAESKPAVPEVAAALAQIEEMKFDNALTKAMARSKIPEDSPLYEVVEMAAKANKPADLNAFVAKYAVIAQQAQTVAAALPPKPPIAASDTGAAVANTVVNTKPPGHPFKWPADVISKMSGEELRAEAREYEAKNGGGADVLDQFRERRARADASRPKK